MKTLRNILMTLTVISSIVFSAHAQLHFTERVGGGSGKFFMLPSDRYDASTSKAITGIAIQHGRRVEQIVLEYTSKRNKKKTESEGNNAGKWSYINLKEGEYITHITGRAGSLIDQVTFHTSMRRTFGPYGGNGGQKFEISIPSDAKVVGFTGLAGPGINKIGLIYKKMRSKGQRPAVRDHRKKGSGTKVTKASSTFFKISQTGAAIPGKKLRKTFIESYSSNNNKS